MRSFSVTRMILHKTIKGLSELIKLLKVGSNRAAILSKLQQLPVQMEMEPTRCHLLETVTCPEAPELTLMTRRR